MMKQVIYYLVGLSIACLGVSLIIHSGVGAGPWDIVNIGLTEKVGLTLGTWMALFQAFFLFVNAVLLKKRPEFAAFITLVIWGFFIDFWMEIIFKDVDLSAAAPLEKWGVFIGGVGTIIIFLVIGQLIQFFHKLSMSVFH